MQPRRVVIIGGGFGGLACARALAGADVEVTLVDKRNHHVFQPLMYQVATAALSPGDIAIPIRRILAKAANIRVLLAEATGIDTGGRRVILDHGEALPYDQVVVATGSVYNYFGHPDWEPRAPAPKTIDDARLIRRRLLRAFEEAERAEDPRRRQALMTFVVVGGGPTGVEMTGTIAELARYTLRGDFRRIDPASTTIILAEAGPKLLAGFPDELGLYVADALRKLGAEVRLNCTVKDIDEDGVQLGSDRLLGATVVWAAGIRAAEGAAWLGGTADKNGRVAVAENLAVPGYEGVYVLGDVALFAQDGHPLPALAQVAQQQGTHLGRELRNGAIARPFRYQSRGDTAVIGRSAAVYSYGKYRMKGRLAWLFWAIVHIFLLIGFQQRAIVMVQWIWSYFTFERGARLID